MFDEEVDNEVKGTVRVGSHGRENITIEGLSKDDFEKVMGSIECGAHWIRVKDRRLEAIAFHAELPKPADDVELRPFWPDPKVSKQGRQLKLFDDGEKHDYSYASITLDAFCPFNRDTDFYARAAEQAESYGFVCLRSRRGKDGRFWEIWYLPSLSSAQGNLADHIAKVKNPKQKMEKALFYIMDMLPVGAVTASGQRWGASPG
jgi:hypothetical protein